MANKKEESIVEKIKEGAEKLVEKVEEVVEDVAEKVEEVVEDIVGKDEKPKKKAVKKKAATKKESDSKDDVDSKKAKLEALKAKAKALEGKVEDAEDKVDLKGKVTGEEEEAKDTLVPIEDYLKASIHLGTRVITPHMRKYVYRRRADGLAVFNTAMFDDKIKEGAKYLAQFAPEDIVIACKREAGWKAVKKFADTFGIKVFTKKYPAGTLTNPNLDDFFEKDLVFICDPWIDKNILTDANKIKIKVISVCDTNNFTFGIDKVIPGNNKSFKSLGMIFFLLTKLYAEERGIKIEEPKIEDYVEGWADLVPPK